ncbi:MAG: D-alanyl-D-alanine carboxypeptidase [Clostridia bacterium]|nr:D-alanyl-D-alanine carboxypeptidase [Clostridia bacterium]
MKRQVLSIVLVVVFFLSSFGYVYSEPDMDIIAETAIVMDGTTGQILYDKNMYEQMYPASTTKIMTAILAIENCDLDQIITIDAKTPFTEGSRTYLVEGEQLTVEQLLYTLLLQSANDSAVALAKHISGSVEEFAKLMNNKAVEIGAQDTNFVNPNGLPDENHVTTAYDLAMIARYAMENETFREMVGTSTVYTIPATEQQDERKFMTRNKLMWDQKKSLYYNGEYISPKYEYATGIKTGFTMAAGNCLVSSAKKDGREVIAVVLKSDVNNVFLDSIKLLENGLNNYKNITIVEQGEKAGSITIESGTQSSVDAVVSGSIKKTVPVDWRMADIEKEALLKESLTAPVKKGDDLGKLIIRHNGEVLNEVAVIALNDVEMSRTAAVTTKLTDGFNNFKYIIFGVLIFIAAYGLLVMKINITRRRKRRIRRNKYQLDNDYIRRNILK